MGASGSESDTDSCESPELRAAFESFNFSVNHFFFKYIYISYKMDIILMGRTSSISSSLDSST